MKKVTIAVLLALAIASPSFAQGEVSASITLRDSSVIKGTVAFDTAFEGAVAFKDSVKLPVATIREMAADGTNGAQIVTLDNGDQFHFTPTTKTLAVATVLGDLSISLSNIRRVTFSAAGKASGGNLIFHCTFDSPEAVLKPSVGPEGTLGNATLTEGKIGMAMHVPRYGSAGLFRFPQAFLKSSGCIEFWAKIDVSKYHFGDCDPRLFAIRIRQSYLLFLEFSSNNGRGAGGLHVHMRGMGAASSRRSGNHAYSELLGENVDGWHHYAVSWDDKLATPLVFIDGRLVPMEVSYQGLLKKSIFEENATVLSLPNDYSIDNGTQPQSSFAIDELKIWDYCKNEFQIED